MKKRSLLLVVVLALPTSRLARADEDPQRKPDTGLFSAGMALTIVGSAFTTVGGALAPSIAGDSESSAHAGSLGAGLVGVGLATATVGTVLWIAGGVRMKRSRARLGLAANGLVGRF